MGKERGEQKNWGDVAQPYQRKLLIANAVIMGGTAVAALWFDRWSLAFVSLATLGLSLAPIMIANRLSISLPFPYLLATTLFVIAAVFLGEAFEFYEKVWWWDLALHGSSALGFGLLGFLFVFMLFDGDRLAAPPSAISFLAFCLAVTIGSLWEIFEFLMDLLFGLNMQKSGLVDSMTDIILNTIGAAIAGVSGYFYLLGRGKVMLGPMIERFINLNRERFRKFQDRNRR